MTKKGKRYSTAATSVEEDRHYSPQEAIALVKSNATAKFDETVELHIRTCLLYTSDAADDTPV